MCEDVGVAHAQVLLGERPVVLRAALHQSNCAPKETVSVYKTTLAHRETYRPYIPYTYTMIYIYIIQTTQHRQGTQTVLVPPNQNSTVPVLLCC